MNDLTEIIYSFMQIAIRGPIEADRDASIIKLEMAGLIKGEDQSITSEIKNYALTEDGNDLFMDIQKLNLKRNQQS